MAGELTIYSVYRLKDQDRYFLIRTERPDFSNASQAGQDAAEAAEHNQRERVLYEINSRFNSMRLEFIGEMQGYPIGEALYSANGNTVMEIYYIETQFGHPWIILGDAVSQEAFLSEIEADEDLQGIVLSGWPIKITVTYLTQNDYRHPV